MKTRISRRTFLGTGEEPYQYPVGIRAVLVNGRVVLLDGERRRLPLSGRALSPDAAG